MFCHHNNKVRERPGESKLQEGKSGNEKSSCDDLLFEVFSILFSN